MLGKGSHPGYPLSPGSSSAPIPHCIILSWSELKKRVQVEQDGESETTRNQPCMIQFCEMWASSCTAPGNRGSTKSGTSQPPELSSSWGRVSIAVDLNLFQSLNHSGKKWKTPKPTFQPLHSLPHPKTSLKQHWGAGCVVTLWTSTQHLPMMCTMVLGAGGSRGPREAPSKEHSLQRAGSSPTALISQGRQRPYPLIQL